MNSRLSLAVIATVLLFSAAFTRAQNFAIDWLTIDGGGGTSTGGVYSASGTIGQPDAGSSSGGSYGLEGGFWGIIATIQTPGAPLLTITLNSQPSTINISWPLPATGFVLDETMALASPPEAISWFPVSVALYQTNATRISITVSPPVGNKFYRLRKP